MLQTEDEVLREEDEFSRMQSDPALAKLNKVESNVQSSSKMITPMANHKSPRITKEVTQKSASPPKRLTSISPHKKHSTLKNP